MSIVSVRNDTLGKVSVINAFAPLAPVITGYNILVSGVIADDTAVDTAGGQTIQVNGTGFISGAVVTLGGSGVTTAYINANTLTFTAPAKTAATYAIYVLNPDGGTAIFIPGVVYSGTPAWTTTAISPASVYETNSITTTALVTTGGDGSIVYSLASGTLPAGATLDAGTGQISGTAPAVGSNTTYTFTIKATDQQLQDSTSTSFTLTINTDVVTWSSPAAASTVTLPQNAASTTALVASSAAGKAITYTSTALPAGLSISGATVTGTPTAVATTAVTFTATAADTSRTATAVINWTISVAADTYFRNTTLLLSGAAATETFVADASVNNFALTIVGDTKPSNFNPYTPGYYSNYFNGTTDYLSAPSNAAFQLGTGDFTIEFWWNGSASGTFTQNIGTLVNSTETGTYRIGTRFNGTNYVYFARGTGASFEEVTYNVNVNDGAWNHIAFVRTSGVVALYVNGTARTAATGSTAISGTCTTSNPLVLGYNGRDVVYSTGYTSNVRVVKGIAVYTGTFTPPATPLSATQSSGTNIAAITGSQTSLLTCQSNRFLDNSTNAFVVTKYGNTTVNPTTPFVPNIAYATQGSTYLNGTTDFLSVPNNAVFDFAAGDFTIEAWMYQTIAPSGVAYPIVSKYAHSPYSWSVGTYQGTWDVGIFYAGSSIVTLTSGTIPFALNTWNHVALTRNGANYVFYVNGIQIATSSNVQTISVSTWKVCIGSSDTRPFYYPGYISNVRIVKGVAVYTSNFTVPTAPLTATQLANTNGNPSVAITGSATSLLTCQTNQPASNSVFLDSSTNAFPVTRAGNTRAGTFTPYGANWSNYFDGIGDYLTATTGSSQLNLPGDFTVELWFYEASTAASIPRFASGTTGGFACGINSYDNGGTRKLDWRQVGAAPVTAVTAITTNVWHHAAFVKSGSAFRMFLDGVLDYYNASYTTTFTSTATYIGSANTGDNSYSFNGYISNLRVVKGTAVYATASTTIGTAIFTPPTAPLTAITNTALLTCQSNRFVDNSANVLAITRTGEVSVQRFSPFSPQTQTAITHSAYFDGTGDYLTAPSNVAFGFGTGDFTIEAWIYRTDTGVQRGIVDNEAGAGNRILFFLTTNGLLNLFDGTSVWLNSAITVPINQWVHVAAVRISGTTKLYINGAQQASSSDLRNYGAAVTYIGRQYGTTTNDFLGYISNVRVVKGVGVYTAAFTVPTAPLTATQSAGTNIAAITGTQTSLLTCQSPTFTDNSTNLFAITAFGEAKPRTVNPFGFTNASAAYSAATYGGSAYFDGTTDYLSVPDNAAFTMGARSFTLEAWVYLTTSGTSRMIIGTCDAGGSQASMSYTLLVNASNNAQFGVGYSGTLYTTTNTATIPTNQWVHIAGVRNGAFTYTYVNGIQSTTNTNMAALAITDSSQVIGIGRNGAGDFEYLTGYISDARIVSGTAVYTSNFVPPTAPLTAITNTSLLLNMTTSGIYNAASMSNLETVADAKILSTQTPYAGSFYSNYFDGSGDYLTVPSNAAFTFGTGAFTIEAWIYPTVYGPTTGNWIYSNISTGSGNSEIGLILLNAGTISLSTWNTAIATSTLTAPLKVWSHVVGSFDGTTYRLFVNGVLSGTSTNVQTLSGTGGAYIGTAGVAGVSLFTGYLSNLRIVKGTAVYTGTFTPPTAPLTAISGTSVLTCQSNRFVDNSTNLFVITRAGGTSVQSFNPFQRNSAATIYFDGNGDYLKVPTNPGFFFGTGDFTIECWAYFNSTATQSIIADINGTTGSAVWGMFYNSTAGLRLVVGAAGTTNSFAWTLSTSTWYHIAITRSGSSLRAYINGVQLGATQSNTSNISVANSTSSGNFYVGNFNTLDAPLNAYINDLRITNGVARYTGATLVLPTTAFIAK